MQAHCDMMWYLMVFLLYVIASNVDAYQYELDTDVELVDKTCPAERRLFDVDAPSNTACAVKCSFDDMCAGISYQRSSRKCIGCAPYKCTSNVAFDQSADTTFYKVTNTYLVSGVRPVHNNYLSASSVYGNTLRHNAISGRICSSSSPGSVGSWEPSTAQQGEWIQARLWSTSTIMRIATGGRNDKTRNHYVKAYKFLYSTDCSTFDTVKHSTGNPVIFPGNTDRYTIVYNDLPTPVDALCVRISPTDWYGYISLRFDVVGYEI